MSAASDSVAWASGNKGTVVRTIDGGRSWTFGGTARLRSVRSAVACVPGSMGRRLIAIGPGGTDSSPDGARTWAALGDEGFHALSISAAGGAAWAVGEQGRIGALQPASGRLLPRRP